MKTVVTIVNNCWLCFTEKTDKWIIGIPMLLYEMTVFPTSTSTVSLVKCSQMTYEFVSKWYNPVPLRKALSNSTWICFQWVLKAVSLKKLFWNSTGSTTCCAPAHTTSTCCWFHLPGSTQPWHWGQNHSSASQPLSGSNPQRLYPPLRCQHHTRQVSTSCQQVGWNY